MAFLSTVAYTTNIKPKEDMIMLESRASYGWSRKPGVRSKEDCEKWEVCYRSDDGSFGILGYLGLFTDKDKAQAKADEFKAKTSWCTEAWIRHPSKCYSNY